uniref:hypothetical protein n=1 Tax=Ningiella ruwaisensis TaxID=2364274 RepID=UPI001F5013C1|nr:hypothetical protein [Ningiella ruwaisensis]
MRFRLTQLLLFIVFSTVFYASNVIAANISGVMGPNIDPNDRSFQVRLAMSPADDDDRFGDIWLYRMHYQHAFNADFRGRLVLQMRDREGFEYDFARAELLYNFRKASEYRWSSALRFEVRTRRGSRPDEVAAQWGNEWDLGSAWRARATLIVSQYIGSNDDGGDLGIQTRGSVSKKLENGVRVGLQLFNSYGELGDFGSYNEQSHEFGPAVSGKFADINYEFRYLHGLSDDSRKHNFFMRFTKKF